MSLLGFVLFVSVVLITTVVFDCFSKKLIMKPEKTWKTVRDLALVLSGYTASLSVELFVLSLFL